MNPLQFFFKIIGANFLLSTGEVVEGFDLVKTIEGYGSSSGKLSQPVKIVNSGTV